MAETRGRSREVSDRGRDRKDPGMGELSSMTSLGSTVLYGTFAIMGGSSLFFLQKLLTSQQPDTVDSPKLKNCKQFTRRSAPFPAINSDCKQFVDLQI